MLRIGNLRTWMVVLTLASVCGAGLAGCTGRRGTAPSETPQVVLHAKVEITPSPKVAAPPTATQIPVKPTRTPLPSPTRGPYLPAAPVWGIELYQLRADTGLDLAKEAGAFWVRRNALLWSEVEPGEGTRNWEALAGLEDELQAAAAQGLQVILVVRSTPEWAQSTPGSLCSAPSPAKLEAFGAFMHDVVRRYSVPPFNVQYWEIGNEPDVAPESLPSDAVFGCWGKTGDPYYGGEYYADILKAVYPQVKSANPQAQVLVGGLLLDCDPQNPPESPPGSGQRKDCTTARYLEGMLRNGAASNFDGISYHAYDYYMGELGNYSNSNWNSAWNTTGPTLIAKANYVRGILNQYGVTDKYLVNTEAALLCGRDGSEPECQSEKFQLTKAYFLAQAYIASISERLLANVWYSLPGWRASGLVDASFAPNQAYQAFKTSATILNGTGYAGEVKDFPGLRGEAFDRNGASLWVLWSVDGADHTIQLERPPIAVTDVFGAPLDISETLTVTLAPIYIEFSK